MLLDGFALSRNIRPPALPGLLERCGAVAVAVSGVRTAVPAERWRAALEAARSALEAHEQAEPGSFGLTAEELAATLPQTLRLLGLAAVQHLTADGDLQRFGRLLRLPGRAVQLSPADEEAWQAMRRVLGEAGLDPPRVAALASALGWEDAELRPLLDTLARLGRLRVVSRHYLLLPEVLDALAARCEALAGRLGLLTVGNLRADIGISRNAVMPMLEFFDRFGFTRRVEDGGQVLRGWPGADEAVAF